MTAIRVIFNGQAFIPQEPVSLPDQAEAVVLIEETDPSSRVKLDAELRAYYEAKGPQDDADDCDWGGATTPGSQRAWDED